MIYRKAALLIAVMLFAVSPVSGVALIPGYSGISPEAEQDDPAAEAYRAAYNEILDSNWDGAIQDFEKLIAGFPGSVWLDDSQYWICYAKEKSGKEAEEVYECYRIFTEKYPESKWVKDAQSNMVRIGGRLAEEGKPEYRAQVEAMRQSGDKEVLLTALFALRNMEGAKVLPVLSKILEENDDSEIREQVIFVLGNLDNPAAQAKLADIALNGKDNAMREKAVFWLGQNAATREQVGVIEKIINSNAPENIRKKAVFALSQAPAEHAREALSGIARKNPEPFLREQAVFWLGQKAETKESVQVLYDIFNSDPDAKVREKAIFALSQAPAHLGMPLLREVALKNDNEKMREKAVFWLGQNAKTEDDVRVVAGIANNASLTDDLRKKAVFALSQAPNRLAKEELMKIAREPGTGEVRKQAVFWLGQGAVSPGTITLLKDIINNDPDAEIREKALFSLSQAPKETGLPVLIDLAKNHPDKKIRTRAIFWLGESNDPRARDALLEIIDRR